MAAGLAGGALLTTRSVLVRATAEATPPPARASHLPVLPRLTPRFEDTTLAARLQTTRHPRLRDDALLTSSVLHDASFTRAVHDWIGYWSGPAQAWFPGFLERMGTLGSTVDSALAAAELPPSLRYLPLIESGYDPRVTSQAHAVGLWQLMEPTARELGLEVTPVLDERRHVHASTGAATRYLRRLHDDFGSWHVALAAYNSGPARVRRILRRHAPGQPLSDSLFWALRGRFPRETRDFLPKLYAAMWVASQPEAYGYTTPAVRPYEFDVVRVPDETTLHVVALAAGAEYEEVVRLNPEYLLAITPEGRDATVRIPSGRARTFNRIYPRIHPAERTRAADTDEGDGEG